MNCTWKQTQANMTAHAIGIDTGTPGLRTLETSCHHPRFTKRFDSRDYLLPAFRIE